MYRNREYLNDRVKMSEKVPEELADVLFDPQTSGGLLLAVPRHKQEVFEQMMGEAGEFFALIGDFMEGAGEIYVYHNIREKEYMPLSRREQR
jgi:selenide,water dikinase